MFQAGVAVVEGDAPVESLVDVYFGTSEAEAASLLGDLEAAAFPLHHVVVADDAFVHEAADALDTFRGGAPGGRGFARLPGETAVVVGDELAQHGVGGVDVGSLGQPQFAGEAILQHAPEALDATLGLRAVGGDEGDAQLFQGTAELSRLAFSGELFFHRPTVVMADEDAAVISVKSEGHAVATQQMAEQAEIAESGFRGEELRGKNLTGGVVLHPESGKVWAAPFEPIVGAAVELHEFAEPRGTHAALAMSGGTALSRRAETVLAQQATKCFATERKALALDQFFAEMMVVEAGVGAAGQQDDALGQGLGQATVTGPPAVGVSQSRLPVFAHTLL